MKDENFKNIKPKIRFKSEIDFDNFITKYRASIKLKEILTDEEIAEQARQKEIDKNGERKLF